VRIAWPIQFNPDHQSVAADGDYAGDADQRRLQACQQAAPGS
jgi:hypothetical protein